MALVARVASPTVRRAADGRVSVAPRLHPALRELHALAALASHLDGHAARLSGARHARERPDESSLVLTFGLSGVEHHRYGVHAQLAMVVAQIQFTVSLERAVPILARQERASEHVCVALARRPVACARHVCQAECWRSQWHHARLMIRDDLLRATHDSISSRRLSIFNISAHRCDTGSRKPRCRISRVVLCVCAQRAQGRIRAIELKSRRRDL